MRRKQDPIDNTVWVHQTKDEIFLVHLRKLLKLVWGKEQFWRKIFDTYIAKDKIIWSSSGRKQNILAENVLLSTHPHLGSPLTHPIQGEMREPRRCLLPLSYPAIKWRGLLSLSIGPLISSSLILSQPLCHLNLDLWLRYIGLEIVQKENFDQSHIFCKKKSVQTWNIFLG